MKNTIIFLMGVSGSGKTTLMNNLLSSYKNFSKVQSYTSRPMRSGEINGDKYFFISDQEFKNAIYNNEFLEYAIVHQKHYYGTKTKDIQHKIDQGLTPIKEIDIHGLEKIKRMDQAPFNYISIFLDIPEELMIKRIQSRQEMDYAELDRRLKSSYAEREKAKELCDYFIDASGTIAENLVEVDKVLYEVFNR